MNTAQVRAYLAAGNVVNRFTDLTPSARRWVRAAFERGEILRANDGFPNGRWMYAATPAPLER